MNNLNIEAALWSLDTLLFNKNPADKFEIKELKKHNFNVHKWESLKAVPLDKIIKIGEAYNIPTNGCGPQSWRFDLVPDRPLWLLGVNFEDPGDCHDILYKTGGNKEDFVCANLYLRYQMHNECRDHFPISWKLGMRYGAITCRIYYEAVDEFGWHHFTKRS